MPKIKKRMIWVAYNPKRYKISVKMFWLAVMMVLGSLYLPMAKKVSAAECVDLKVIFMRGSGEKRYEGEAYLAFKNSLNEKLKISGLSYKFEDLDYPAVSIDVGDGHFLTLLAAYFGGGEAYDFGDSVHAGTKELLKVVNGDVCRNTKYVLGGYSQGAIVLMDGLEKINPDKVIYAVTFGDPKIYLPEGAGLVPVACGGKNLSEYRAYVPDCRAHKGLLGARIPYRADSYSGKVGTWCNKHDVLCSSHLSVTSHTAYAREGLYEDASRLIYSKIAKEFGFRNQYTSPHDTAILIDSTGSMGGLIDEYKAEALRLAEKTLAAGGRVALYDYRDVGDDYVPVERCNFENCDLENFRTGLNDIQTDGGGDEPESLLSASLHVMKELNWKFGSVKSLVILTDAGYHSPDLDGTTFYDVVKLSKQIDPVNFYVVTIEGEKENYHTLVEATDGAVVSTVDDLSNLTDTILERYDSLPRVEEEDDDGEALPTLIIKGVEEMGLSEVKIDFEMTGNRALVILNDAILGMTDQKSIRIGELDRSVLNRITLVPLSETRRGEGEVVELEILAGGGSTSSMNGVSVVPKAPNTGRQ